MGLCAKLFPNCSAYWCTIVVFVVRRREREVMPGFRLPHRCNGITKNYLVGFWNLPPFKRIVFVKNYPEFLESTGGRHNIFLEYALRQSLGREVRNSESIFGVGCTWNVSQCTRNAPWAVWKYWAFLPVLNSYWYGTIWGQHITVVILPLDCHLSNFSEMILQTHSL